MRLRVAIVAMLVAVCAVATAGPNQDKADALFKKGKALLGQQQYAEACAAFEESQELDPGIGTALNIALCYEGWGKVAKAQRAYLEAEKLAALKGDKRASAARQRAEALAPRVPKILFTGLPEAIPADLVVTLDDEPIGIEGLKAGVSTDPGAHVVVYTVEGAKQTIRIELAESSAKEVKLDLPAPKEAPDPDTGTGTGTGTGEGTGPVDGGAGKRRGRGRRIAGIVTASVGVAAVGTGIALAFKARSDYNKAFDEHCDATGCDDIGFDRTHDARKQANVATLIVGVGGAALVTGVIVWLTAPSGSAPPKRTRERVWIRPEVTDGGAALVIGGSL